MSVRIKQMDALGTLLEDLKAFETTNNRCCSKILGLESCQECMSKYEEKSCSETVAYVTAKRLEEILSSEPKDNTVTIGEIKTFTNVKPDKAQALKPLEEAAELFSEWQFWDAYRDKTTREDLLDECADVIQAVCNLAASLGIEDMEPYMQACEQRNRDRGRM